MARSKSITEIQILNLLGIRPMYGAEMIEEIKRLSGNTVVMSLPTLYSALHKLATKKLVNSYWQEAEIGGRRHVYNITKLGRDYYEKNKIEINYDLLKSQPHDENKPFSTLEEAFSLPLNNQTESLEDKRVLQIEPQPTETEVKFETSPEPINEPKPIPVQMPTVDQKNKNKVNITPYVLPTDKITATNNNSQHKQMSINLAGTVGTTELRPLLHLNHVTVGNEFVMINRLRIIACLINVAIFALIDFLLSLTKTSQSEYYYFIYLTLLVYLAIDLSIYFVFPRVKAVFDRGKAFRIRAWISLSLIALVIIISIVDRTLNLIWLSIFAFVPIAECLLMIGLRKGKIFQC